MKRISDGKGISQVAPRPLMPRTDAPTTAPTETRVQQRELPAAAFLDDIRLITTAGRWGYPELVVPSRLNIKQKHSGTSTWNHDTPYYIPLRESIRRGNSKHRALIEAALAVETDKDLRRYFKHLLGR